MFLNYSLPDDVEYKKKTFVLLLNFFLKCSAFNVSHLHIIYIQKDVLSNKSPQKEKMNNQNSIL